MDQILTDVLSWANTHPDIRAAILVGSRAHTDPAHPPDRWSDLDLILYTMAQDLYRQGAGLLPTFEHTLLARLFPRQDGQPEYLILLDSGLKVDLAFYALEELEGIVAGQVLPGVYRRGYSVRLDKDGLAGKMPRPPETSYPREQPTEADYREIVESFWYAAFQQAKYLRRGDLWVARLQDRALKDALLRMLEWHAGAAHGWQLDTWHDGRFMHEWAGERTWLALQIVFGHFDAVDSWRALFATIGLFREAAVEVGRSLGFAYTPLLDRQVMRLVETIRAESDVN